MKYIVFGMISGICMALGLGGGTILIILLDIFTNYTQTKIQGINLIFFVGASIIAIFMNAKNKTINYIVAKTTIVYGCIGACIGAILSNKIHNKFLKKYFGFFLILIAINGIYTLISQYIKTKKAKNRDVK